MRKLHIQLREITTKSNVILIQVFLVCLYYINSKEVENLEMNADKKQKEMPQGQNAEIMVINYPAIALLEDKNSNKFFDLDHPLTLEQTQNKKIYESEVGSFQTLRLISKEWISIKDHDLYEIYIHDPKSEKNVQQMQTLATLPTTPKDFMSQAEYHFEMQDQTSQNVMSSEQYEKDSQSNGTELPVSSVGRNKSRKVSHEQSEGSDDMPEYDQNHRIFHMRQNYAQSKGSDLEEQDDIMTICQHCTSLFDKCKRLQAENGEHLKQIQILGDQLAKYEEQQLKIEQASAQRQQSFINEEPAPISPSLIKELFLFQISQSYKTLIKVNQLLASYDIDFPQSDCEYLERFRVQFKKIEAGVLGKEERQERKQQLERIHSSYKKLICKMIKNHEAVLAKKDADFKKFVNSLMQKHHFQPIHLLVPLSQPQHHKGERLRRKSKTLIDKQEVGHEQFFRMLLEQDRQKIQWLQLNHQKEKDRYKLIQRSLQEEKQKYICQLNDQIKEKNIYKNQLKKYTKQFADFIEKLIQDQTKKLIESQFFKTLCQRIFQISNSIPFEENDEQNLFAPQNQAELYEMIERIRKFYLKFEFYNVSRQNYFQNEKNLFMTFMKQLVEQSKVSQNYVLEMLGNKKYSSLNYIKELINSPRQKSRKSCLVRHQKYQNLTLKIERAHNFTIDADHHTA